MEDVDVCARQVSVAQAHNNTPRKMERTEAGLSIATLPKMRFLDYSGVLFPTVWRKLARDSTHTMEVVKNANFSRLVFGHRYGPCQRLLRKRSGSQEDL